ncbi:MAG: RNA polymerase sigma factor [Actinomycetia bacterium]|nr:RNA polymerase sigma factor [Actinomycetes bacterium]
MQPQSTESVEKGKLAGLFTEFADATYTLGYRILGDRHLAEDVVQETFIKVIRALPTYRGEGPIAGWIYRIGYREAIAISRKRRDDVTDPDSTVFTNLPAAESVEDTVISMDLIDRLDRAMLTLSEPVRAAFTLRDIQGMSTQEVAEILGVSQSAVKMRLARAREALRVQLKEYLT